jgi:hypothetical protein
VTDRSMPMPTPSDPDPALRRRNRFWFALTVALLVFVLTLLPRAVTSMLDELSDQSTSRVYEFLDGSEIDFANVVAEDATFINIAVTHVEEARQVATLSVSGNRNCGARCPPIAAALYSLGQDASRRLGLPPSAAIDLPAASGPFTQTIELPVRGWPQRYPFDSYILLLGLAIELRLPNGEAQPLTAEVVRQRNVHITIEDAVARLNMSPPQRVDPASVDAAGANVAFVAVDRLTFQRPTYLRILTIVLVLLIAASAVFALSLKDLEDLLLGIGGIILGVWGVRSVVVQTELSDLTWVDIALAVVILVLLLALAVRAARHYYRLSGFRGLNL